MSLKFIEEKISTKKGAIIFNLFIIVFFWIVFVVFSLRQWYKIVDFLDLFTKSYFSIFIYLIGVPILFSALLFFLVVKKNIDKKTINKEILIPFAIWLVLVVLPIILFYFFGFSG